MFRTRDFVLVLTVVAFLLMAIGVTVFSKWQSAGQTAVTLQPAKTAGAQPSAVVENSHKFSREKELQAMRDKIAAQSELSITAPEPVESIVEAPATTSTTTKPAELANAIQLCPSYHASSIQWSPYDIEMAEVEGIRMFYREIQNVAQSATGTPTVQRDILAELPVRSFPAVSTTCLASDVVGIATDGSLIRNNEVALYGIFGSTTLIGWALDGFPIYGTSATAGDVCGGVSHASGYRYQLSAERDTILNCYSATPIHL